MLYTTTINSNGSKWAGQAPDTIDDLLMVLQTSTIEACFFWKIWEGRDRKKKLVHTPITRHAGRYHFFGNFEEVSHVFNIETNDPAVIAQLRAAIMNNPGWKQYIGLCKNVA